MPNRADDTTLPPEPTGVAVYPSQTRLQVSWDSPLEGDTGNSDASPDWSDLIGTDWDEIVIEGRGSFSLTEEPVEDDPEIETDDEIAFFQVQVATDAQFGSIILHDRMVVGHSRTWRVRKPGDTVFHARVRTVDISGNKSAWVVDGDTNAIVPQPATPVLSFERQAATNRAKAVITVTNVSFDDESISRYQFQLREINFTHLTNAMTSSDPTFIVDDFETGEVPMDPDTDSPDFTVFIEDEQLLVTSISGGANRTWHADRAQNATVAAAHAAEKRVSYFGQSGKSDSVTVSEEPDTLTTSGIVRNCDLGVRYRARVRAIDAQNRKSTWSGWTNSVKAVIGADSTGAPGVEPPPSVTSLDYPFERVFRYIQDILTGFESDPITGLDGTVTAARAVVGVAPTTDATFHINLNGVSFLTVTIPAGEVQSDLTWVIPPLFIGQRTGQTFINTDDITTFQNNMTDAAGGLTVYVLVYLADGS